MFKNYLLIAVRNLSKNLGYTSINVIGLAIGLASCLLVTLYIRFELSYENFHNNKDKIYRYIPRGERDGLVRMQTFAPAGFGPLVKENFREVESFTRFSTMDERPLLKHNENVIDAKSLVLADPEFFKIFSFKLIEGKAESALSRPFTIVISKSIAEKHFAGSALGKIIRYDNAYDLEVTGVFEDVPANSHLKFSYVVPFESVAKIVEDRYKIPAHQFLSSLDAWNYSTYFYIPNAKDISDLAKRIDKKFTEARKEEFDAEALGDWLQPLNEIHFTKGIRGDSANGDMNTIFIFSAIAIMILLIACFNFMNLSTARAIKRSKEVGLRKVMGAIRYQLIKQFLGETLVLVLISMVLCIILLEFLVPLFNSLIGQQLNVVYFGKNSILWVIVAAGTLTGLIAGSYPAFYLSSFTPAKVLKGQTGVAGNAGLRKVLTVMQFGVATFLLIGTLVVSLQMRFIQNTNLGFNKENIIYMNPPAALWPKVDVFKETLISHNNIKSVSVSNGTPGMENSTWRYDFPGTNIPERPMNTLIIDYDYLNTYGLELIEGRNLSKEFATDSLEAYLVNEAAVRDLMIEKPIGHPIRAKDGHPVGRIVGVVKDFHYRSLHRAIEPLVLRIDPGNTWCISVRMGTGNLSDNLKTVERVWRQFQPDYPFTYEFLDETIERQYRADQNTGILLTSFTILAILIACLGLLGLTSFMTEQRKKEIGIRKVLGASVSNIVVLLSRDFSKLVLIGFLVVIPLAWYAVQKWLENFTYKTEINPLIYLIAGMIIGIIAWLSIAYQSIKAATVNPTETLRNE
ncbi:ABC transporter permease [Chryseosolibacter indicus]|uniref:ABC transporter permease n=1 Tax=Chryseosolibacter indicus TaxID=2782351 RepID=A0ABS5VPX9_9BACT|nr:ABC transporter permease [Chryseosolibacter indicus]MBT1703073.1 ABC transporter permease [Chryseosolibacter indicus]